MTEKQSSDEKVRSLKLQVLNEHRDFLCRELGDPARYLPYLRSKGVLDDNSADRIKSKATTSDKVAELVESLNQCGENYNGHPLDVLIEGIKRQKVQLHISRVLLKAANKLIRDTAPQGENSVSTILEPFDVYGEPQSLGFPTLSKQFQNDAQQDTPVGGNMPSPVASQNILTGSRPPRPDYSRFVEDDPAAGSHTAEHDGYDNHPEYGPLPPHLPSPVLKVDGIAAASNHDNGEDIHPEYGPLPSAPPTTIHRSDGSSDSISSLERQQQAMYPPPPLCPSPNPALFDNPTAQRGHGGTQEVPSFPGYAHGDDSEYYRTQLDQKDVDIRSLQFQLRAAREENDKLKARIDTLEKDLTLARQGRGLGGGGTLGAPRPAHLPFSRSPEHNPNPHAHSLGTPQSMAHSSSLPLVKGSGLRHDKRSSNSSHHNSLPTPTNSLATPLNSLITPINNSRSATTPIIFDSMQHSTRLSTPNATAVTLTSTGHEHSTDV